MQKRNPGDNVREADSKGKQWIQRQYHVSNSLCSTKLKFELALTSYQIASGGQSESDTENIEFVQVEIVHIPFAEAKPIQKQHVRNLKQICAR
jgi:hypothetical protein